MGGNVVFSSLNGLGVKVELPRSKRLADILSENECLNASMNNWTYLKNKGKNHLINSPTPSAQNVR